MTGERLHAAVEVTAGVIPGIPEAGLGRRWTVSAEEWFEACESHDEMAPMDLLGERLYPAIGYTHMLATSRRANWVRLEWVWM